MEPYHKAARTAFMRRTPHLASLLLLPVVGGCHGLHEIGGFTGQYSSSAKLLTGPMKSETRPVGSFTKVVGSGALEIDVRQGASPKCVVEAAAPVLSHIKSKVEGDTLILQTEGSFRNDKPMKVHLTMASLSSVHLTGASQIQSAATWPSGRFEVEFNGASKGNLRIKTAKVEARLTGASEIELSGSASDLRTDLSGASQIRAEKLPLRTANIQASGASRAELVVSDSISGEISGASNVRYRGKPKVRISASGVSSVESF